MAVNMTDEKAVDVMRRTVQCYIGMPTFCQSKECIGCENFFDRHSMVQALMLGIQALEDRMREPPEVVLCRDCALEGTVYCKFTRIEKARLIFMDRPLTWFCADGVRKEETE